MRAPKLAAIASDTSLDPAVRLSEIVRLVPLALTAGFQESSQGRLQALDLLACARELLTEPFSELPLQDFQRACGGELQRARALVLSDASEEDLSLVIASASPPLSMNRESSLALFLRCLNPSCPASPQTLLGALRVVKLDLSDFETLAHKLIDQAGDMSPDHLLEVATMLRQRASADTVLVQKFAAAFLDHVGRAHFGRDCKIADTVASLCYQDSNASVPASGNAADLKLIYQTWIADLGRRSGELPVRLLLIRDTIKAETRAGSSSPGSKGSCDHPALRELVRSVEPSISSMPTSDALNLALGLSRLVYRELPAYRALAQRLAPSLPELTDQDIRRVAVALAHRGYRDLELFGALKNEALRRLPGLSPTETKRLCEAFFDVQALDRELAEAFVSRALASKAPLALRACLARFVSLVRSDLVEKLVSKEDLSRTTTTEQTGLLLCALTLSGKFVFPEELPARSQRYFSPRASVAATTIETIAFRMLSRALNRSSLGIPLTVEANRHIAGIETDILVVAPNQRFVIEIDGPRFHKLFGPDSNNLRFGRDEVQDRLLQSLGYRVFHVPTQPRLPMLEGEITRVADQILESLAKSPSSSPRRNYPY